MKPAVSAQRMHKDILPSVTLEHYPYLFLKDPPKLSFTNSLLYIKVSRRLSQKFVWQLWPLNHLKQISFFRLFCRLCRGPLLLNQSILQRQRSITANMDEDWPLIIQFVQRSSGFAPQIGQNLLAFQTHLAKTVMHIWDDNAERSMEWIYAAAGWPAVYSCSPQQLQLLPLPPSILIATWQLSFINTTLHSVQCVTPVLSLPTITSRPSSGAGSDKIRHSRLRWIYLFIHLWDSPGLPLSFPNPTAWAGLTSLQTAHTAGSERSAWI